MVMGKNEIRRYRRFYGYDYSRGAALFITIVTNPLKFELRYNQPEFLAIHKPLAAWRLSTEEFWRGIGAVDLLDCDKPFIALRISRRLSPQQVREAVACAQTLPSGQGPESGDGVMPERVYPRGKAVYWLPEGPKLVS